MRVQAVAIALAVAAAVAACGQEQQVEQPEQAVQLPKQEQVSSALPIPSADTSIGLDTSPTIEQIKRRGELRIGIRADDPQFAVRAAAGEYTGFDVEIARLLARSLGLDPNTQVSYRMLPESMLTSAVATGNVDVLLSSPVESEQLAETGPYVVADAQRGQRFLITKQDDAVLHAELEEILRSAVADGSWEQAYERTLGQAGVAASPR